MQPDISRRCLSCGASVRSEALFCPECGQSLSQRPDDSTPSTAEEASAPAAEQNAEQNALQNTQSAELNTLGPEAANTSIEGNSFAAVIEPTAPSAPVKASATPTTKPRKDKDTRLAAKVITPALASPGHERAGRKAREKLHRASTAARGAIEGNVKRVERIRQVSSVVLEEAHYDSSLRFVLVAVALFVIVAVLLVLSKVMG
jgi:zinc-ribbon domain